MAGSTGMTVYVGGVTAGAVDFATTLGHKLPLFIGVVVLLSALLLLIVFRSLVIPLQAAVMNLLSIGAALGVIVAIFQWGWLGGLIGVQQGPIESFIPVMLFAIVFGLSMDYEVFLISRMHERWTHTGDNQRAVGEGLALTGRVVTAAAAIMVCVFLSFMLGEDRVIKEFGLSLASAVFLDALVIRCLLLPAVLTSSAPRTWRIPAWLDRLLPRINIEGTRDSSTGPPQDEAAPGRPRRPPTPRSPPRERRAEPTPRGGPRPALRCAARAALIWPAGPRRAGAGRSAARPALASLPTRRASPPGAPAAIAVRRRLRGRASEQLARHVSMGIMCAAQGTTRRPSCCSTSPRARASPPRPTAPASARPRAASRRARARWSRLGGRAAARRRRAAAPRAGPARRTDPRRRRLRGDRRRADDIDGVAAADRGGADRGAVARLARRRCRRASPPLEARAAAGRRRPPARARRARASCAR